MRIVRFVDQAGSVHHGCDYDGTEATLLSGEPLGPMQPTARRIAVARLLAPIEPRAILCIGLNYRRHAEETGAAIPSCPVLFMKNPAAVNDPGAPIVLPRDMIEQPEVDYEVELAVVIGRAARDVSRDEALDYVWGYTVGNDVSARRVQKHLGGGQWVRGKSFDTFCPLGPELVTTDELGDPQTLALSTELNGRLMQSSNTADMIFSVAQIIEYLSTDMTLLPGTVVLTGTPSGVGVGRVPPVFLHPGDRVTCRIDRIGALENPVTAG